MKETIIMNIKNTILYWLYMVLCLTACADEVVPKQSSNTNSRLCFRVNGATSRIAYDGVASTFENGDKIGCVIACRNGNDYQFLSNSEWHYNNGLLVLDNDGNNGNILSRETSGAEDGFLVVTGGGTYYFFFYYPYVTIDLVSADIRAAIRQYKENTSLEFYKYLSFPHCGTNTDLNFNYISLENEWAIPSYYQAFTLCGIPAVDTNTQNLQYNWLSFPCFVNYYQATKAASNYSDFLWCISRSNNEGGINSNSTNTINLTFEKKTATIDVISDIPLTNIYFQIPQEEEQTMLRGKRINLQTGELSDYTYNANGTTNQEKQMYMAETNVICPYNLDENQQNFRLILPAQSYGFRCDMYFQLNNTEELYTISLHNHLTALQEGGRYIVHINSRGESTLEIVDWDNEHFEVLQTETIREATIRRDK